MIPFYQKHPIQGMPRLYAKISENLSFVPHLHRQMELALVLDGALEATVDGQSRLLHPGEAAFCASDRPHAYITRGYSRILLLIWEDGLLPRYRQLLSGQRIVVPFACLETEKAERDVIVSALCEKREEETKTAYLSILLGYLFERFHLRKDSFDRDDSLTTRALKYLDDCYRGAFSLSRMAEALYVSKYHLSRAFNAQIGYGILEYVNILRVTDACAYLTQTDESIGSIALECGFGSLRSFNRVFLQETGATPGAYRAAKRI